SSRPRATPNSRTRRRDAVTHHHWKSRAMNADLRSVKTPPEQALSDAYAAAKPKLPGKGKLAALREDAFRRFDANGLPHRRVEEWKYTDLRALVRETLPLAVPPDATAKAKAKKAAELFAAIDG